MDEEGFGFDELTQDVEYSKAFQQFLDSLDKLEEVQNQK